MCFVCILRRQITVRTDRLSYAPNRERQPVGRPWYVPRRHPRVAWPVSIVWTNRPPSNCGCATFSNRGNTSVAHWPSQKTKFQLKTSFQQTSQTWLTYGFRLSVGSLQPAKHCSRRLYRSMWPLTSIGRRQSFHKNSSTADSTFDSCRRLCAHWSGLW